MGDRAPASALKKKGSLVMAANFLARKASEAAIGGSSQDARHWEGAEGGMNLPDNFFSLSCNDAKGGSFDLKACAGKPTLVVNVASF